MIGTIDVEIMAANPSMPLFPVRAFKNSPSNIRLRNVPKRIGNWNITSVQIVAAYPDSSIKTTSCVLVGGVWVGTIEGCPISGRSENGFTVFASGIDENGNPVSNYVLGKGLIEILEGDGTIIPDAPSYYVHLLSAEPSTPKEGDMWPTDDGYVIWQDGEEHKLGISAEEVSTMISDEVPDIVTEKVEVGVGDNWRNYINETRKPYWNSDANLWTWVDIGGDPLESSAPEDTIELVFNGYYLGATIKLLLTEFEVFGEEGEYLMKLVFSDGTEHEVTYKDSVGYFTYNGTNYYPQGDVSQWALDNYHTFEVEGGITFKFYRDSEMRNALGLATYDELQMKQDALTTTQLSTVNSGITSSKVSTYDGYASQIQTAQSTAGEALTKLNYALHTATMPAPYIPSNMYPITYEASDMTFTINESDWGSSLNVSDVGGNYILTHHNSTFDVDINLCFITYSGKYGGDGDINTTKFNGVTPTINVTQVLTIAAGYELEDRAVNTLSVDPSKYTCPLVFPTLIPNHTRDFILRIYAYAGNYTPTLSASGVTLMNAEGTMPEIATDENAAKTTLVYFSEIAPNTFLVKGEPLEAIS